MSMKFANQAYSTLASSIADSDTTIHIQSGDADKFPALGAGDWFPLVVTDGAGNMEIMVCTARDGAELTVSRAQEDTSALAFDAGTGVYLRITSAMLGEFLQAARALADLPDKPAALANLGAGMLAGHRNKLINPRLLHWQRGASFSNISGGGSIVFTADRIFFSQNGTAANAIDQIASGAADHLLAMRIRRPSGSSDTQQRRLGQVVETIDAVALAGKTATVGVQLAKGADFSAASASLTVYFGTGVDEGAAVMQTGSWAGGASSSLSIAAADIAAAGSGVSDHRLVVSVPASTREIGFRLSWSPQGTAGAADDLILHGFFLDEGNAMLEADPFAIRPYAIEQTLVDRFYQIIGGTYFDTTSGGSTIARGAAQCRVPMRTTPSAILYPSANANGTAGNAYNSNTNSEISGITAGGLSPRGFDTITTSGSFTSGNLLRVSARLDAETY